MAGAADRGAVPGAGPPGHLAGRGPRSAAGPCRGAAEAAGMFGTVLP